jgi:L-alanine-DL-glutamate epimerase-like enolase superfamily enzyme
MHTPVRAGRRETADSGHPVDPIDAIDVAMYTIPTEQPEADGTLSWDSTGLLLVQAHASGQVGVGYSYTQTGAAQVVSGKLADVVSGMDAMAVGRSWAAMWQAVRNYGQTGLVSTAISAVDVALWDLKARLLGVPLVDALDAVHEATPIYGSGGFCSYDNTELAEQLSGWAEAGIPRVKMKTGRNPDADRGRLAAARDAIGDDIALYVDANGAFARSQAVQWAQIYADYGVSWYEEPVSSEDLPGLHLVRDRAPGGVEVAAGEYGWNLPYFQRMLDAEAVHCLQADLTRCGGISGFLRAAALCDARSIDLSAHCAPQISAQACTAVWHLRHLEYFHDHNRLEHLVFDGCLEPEPGGLLRPDRSRPGHGLAVKYDDIERWRVQ